MTERNHQSLIGGSSIEVKPGNLNCRMVINSIALSRATSLTQPKSLTHENIYKQIQNIMQKVNMLEKSSVSLSCLIQEPSKSERDLFINAFLPALKQVICLKGRCHITHVRLVQEDKQSTEEFLNVFKTYVDQQRHLDFSQEHLVNISMTNASA